jgi:hypothetical protein
MILPSGVFAYHPADIVISLSGDLPLLPTVPHDGQGPLEAAPARTRSARISGEG